MQYASLHDLISNSSSSRSFFLSCSVPLQRELHKYNDCIHNAYQLHEYARIIPEYDRSVKISEMLFNL